MSELPDSVDSFSEESPRATLRQRTAVGLIWIYGLQVSVQVLAFSRNLVLARILLPEQFGIAAIAVSGFALFNIISESGLNKALIQKMTADRRDIDTGWVVQIARGLFISALLFLLAEPVASIYENAAAADAVRWISLAALVATFRNIGLVRLSRRLQIKRLFYLNTAAEVVATITAITAAVVLGDARAILFGLIAAEIIRTSGSYIASRYRPKFYFEWLRAKSLFKFGIWIYLAGLLAYFGRQGHQLIIPKYLSIEDLGVYAMASLSVIMLSRQISGGFQKVLLPALASIQSDHAAVKRVYLKSVGLVAIPATGAFVGLMAVSEPFIRTAFGDVWIPAIIPLQILAISTYIKVVFDSSTTLLNALGIPRISFTISASRAVVLAVAIVPAIMAWGTAGVAWAVLMSSMIGMIVSVIQTKRKLNIGVTDFIRALWGPVAASVFMILVLILFTNQTTMSMPLLLVIRIVLGAVSYMLFLAIISWKFRYQGLADLRATVNSVRNK
jgi:lipopolysaccharide exporter